MLAHKLPPDAGSLADEWASLHRGEPFAVHDCELHYLSTTALSAADDLVAHLLLKKLKLSTKLDNGSTVPVVRMNSFVEFSMAGNGSRSGRLVHPSAPVPRPQGISICSLIGAGLVGLGEGQSILWPDEAGRFRPLSIIRIGGSCVDHQFTQFGKMKS
jgi:regulator of nucleoside diphosphate kinase